MFREVQYWSLFATNQLVLVVVVFVCVPGPGCWVDLKYFFSPWDQLPTGSYILFPRCADTWAGKDFGAQRHSTHHRPSFKPQIGSKY